MRASQLLAFLPILLGGCTPPAPPPAADYHLARQALPLVLAFAPGSDEPARLDADRLRYLGATLPAWIVPEFHAAGPRTLARARAVRRLLERPLVLSHNELRAGTIADQDSAVVLIQATSGILPDACLGPGQPVSGDVWPGDDARRATLLPAGCAVATALQAQVAAAVAEQDLLRGRPLPPGAATPFTDAIERYYRRNDPSGRGNSAAAGGNAGLAGSANTDVTPSAQGTAGRAGPGANPANPLLGPLPDGPAP